MQFRNGQASRPALAHRRQRFVKEPVEIVEARLPLNANRVGHVAFVRAYRLQRRGLADNGAVWSQLGRLGEVAGAGHAGLFIGRRQNIERLFQLSDVNVA